MRTVTVSVDGMFWMMLRIWLVLSGKENGKLLGGVEEVSCKMMMMIILLPGKE